MIRYLENYGCPECGYDGPHFVMDETENTLIVECGSTDCAAEFEVPIEVTQI